jgi:hypothetical protein
MLLVNITDQVSQPYRTHCEIRVVQILILTSLHVNWEEKNAELAGSKLVLILVCS